MPATSVISAITTVVPAKTMALPDLFSGRFRKLAPGGASHGDLQPGVTGGIAYVQDALGELLGELVAADVEQDGDESRLLVLADLRRAPLAERVDRRGDMRQLLHVRIGRLDRLLYVGVRDLARSGVETRGLLPFCCGGTRSASRSAAAWPVSPRETEIVARVAAEAVGDGAQGSDENDPGDEDDPVPSRREHAEPVESPGHPLARSRLEGR
jgi:hypothetical protein